MSNQSSPRALLNSFNEKPEQDYQKNASNNDNKDDLANNCCNELATDFINLESGDGGSQTCSDSGCNTENPNSLTTSAPPPNLQHSRIVTPNNDKATKASASRNPITGMGLNGDGVGGLKPLKPKCRRDGNPVTGEGYKSNDFNHTPSLNGANQIINKNRIPPGGFSSGLW